MYIANFILAKVFPVSASFFINLNEGLSSIVSFTVFSSTVYFSSVPSSLINFKLPSVPSTLNVMSFTFTYPSGANTSFNVYVASSTFPSIYWYKSSIVTVPVSSVIYSPISFVPLYSLNLAPAKYVSSGVSCGISSFTSSSFSVNVVSNVFFTFIICKLYLGVFSSSKFIVTVGILSFSSVLWPAIVPAIVCIL